MPAINCPNGTKSNRTVEIDEIDIKILRELIEDARTKIKDIAKKCGLSCVAIVNRVKRLKAAGVITGAVLYLDMSGLGYMYPASIGINLNCSQELKLAELIHEKAKVVMFEHTIGENDVSIFCVARSIRELDELKQILKKQPQVRRVTLNIWSTPYFTFKNLDIHPTKV